MFAIPKSDPLDVLVFGIGLRLTQLAKMGDPKFKKLLENRNFTIQMGSEAQNLYRTFTVENGRFSQASGKADKPTLSIDFKNSMTGAKLLTKGDAAAFMVGVQNGDVKMSGDYSLLMWFNQVAKYIVPKVPEQLQPAVEMAKPFITKATPVAKDLCGKAMSLLAGFGILGGEESKASDKPSSDKEGEKKSKYFSDDKSDVKKDEKSLVDTAKEKLADVKADVEEKVSELKDKAEETLADVKDKAEDLTKDAKDKLAEVKSEASEKLDTAKDKANELKSDAETKVAEVKTDVKDKAEDLTKDAKDKLETVKSEATDKLAEVKTDVKEKAETVKTEAENKTDDLKEVIKKANEEKSQTVKDNVEDKADNLTPAQKISHELEEKHAGEKVIAENVKIDAVKDDKSPVTEVMVTRASDTK